MYQMCRILINLKSEATVGHQAIDQQLLDLPRGGKLMQDLSRAAGPGEGWGRRRGGGGHAGPGHGEHVGTLAWPDHHTVQHRSHIVV